MVLSRFPSRLGVTDASRAELSRQFRFSTGTKTEAVLTKLEVDGESPENAQALANALIDAWLATTKPPPASKLELERKLKLNQEALDTVSRLLTRLTGETTKLIMANMQFDLATPTVQLLQLRNGYVESIAAIEMQLRGSTRDVINSPPTLPTDLVAPKKGLIALVAAMGSGFSLLLWVFMRQGWKNAAFDPQAAEKQARLRTFIGFKRLPN